jgi:hypothetical protein
LRGAGGMVVPWAASWVRVRRTASRTTAGAGAGQGGDVVAGRGQPLVERGDREVGGEAGLAVAGAGGVARGAAGAAPCGVQVLVASGPVRAARRLVHIPVGRFAGAGEIAAAAAFLAGGGSSVITASSLLAGGGISGAYVTPLRDSLLRRASGFPSVPGSGSVRASGRVRCTRMRLFLPEARILPVNDAQDNSRGGMCPAGGRAGPGSGGCTV